MGKCFLNCKILQICDGLVTVISKFASVPHIVYRTRATADVISILQFLFVKRAYVKYDLFITEEQSTVKSENKPLISENMLFL